MLTKIAALTVLTLAALPVLAAPAVRAATPLDPNTRAIFSDDKGHYRADWASGQNRPAFVQSRLIAAGLATAPAVTPAPTPAPAASAPHAITSTTHATAPSPARRLTNDKGRML